MAIPGDLTTGIVGHMRFQVSARDSYGFGESVMAEVAKLPGVQAVAPVLEQSANVWVFMWLPLPSACPPACWTVVQ